MLLFTEILTFFYIWFVWYFGELQETPGNYIVLLRIVRYLKQFYRYILQRTDSSIALFHTTTSSLFFLQEKYLSALVAATPVFALRHSSAWAMSDSSLSIDSLLLAAEDPRIGGTLTPEVARRSNPFNKAMGTLG